MATVSFQETTPATLPADGKQYATVTVSSVEYFPQMIVDPTTPTQRAAVGSDGALKTQRARGTKTFTTDAPTASASVSLAANSSRKTALIQNVGAVDAYMGKDGTVTTSNGLLLEAGASLIDDTSTDAWWAVTASGTGDLRICEVA